MLFPSHSMLGCNQDTHIAEAYITAATITDPATVTAVYDFADELDDAGVWDKIICLYPIIGTTWGQVNKNIKIPPGESGTYLQMVTSAGATIGTNVIPKQNKNMSTAIPYISQASLDNVSMFGYYINNTGGFNGILQTLYDNGTTNRMQMINYYNNWRFALGTTVRTALGGDWAGGADFFVAGTCNGANMRVYRNGAIHSTFGGYAGSDTGLVDGAGMNPRNFAIGLSGGATYLDATEISALYTAVDNLNTALGR